MRKPMLLKSFSLVGALVQLSSLAQAAGGYTENVTRKSISSDQPFQIFEHVTYSDLEIREEDEKKSIAEVQAKAGGKLSEDELNSKLWQCKDWLPEFKKTLDRDGFEIYKIEASITSERMHKRSYKWSGAVKVYTGSPIRNLGICRVTVHKKDIAEVKQNAELISGLNGKCIQTKEGLQVPIMARKESRRALVYIEIGGKQFSGLSSEISSRDGKLIFQNGIIGPTLNEGRTWYEIIAPAEQGLNNYWETTRIEYDSQKKTAKLVVDLTLKKSPGLTGEAFDALKDLVVDGPAKVVNAEYAIGDCGLAKPNSKSTALGLTGTEGIATVTDGRNGKTVPSTVTSQDSNQPTQGARAI